MIKENLRSRIVISSHIMILCVRQHIWNL